ncbi:DUF732 domain-containing protein [[Mycobacterium] zoologicum]|uniref:DUF732 domain-containing protein n=1 Tax=[Mycobacterium] zoologicum TaxID=2872311 RepID=UPI001CDA7452|nr:DUF732 domain-containing protein [Mycolicibacter sp. MYC101]MEB3064440.1 DUF732 domain-containing protein [Mycolicibacter sp. MYC101]
MSRRRHLIAALGLAAGALAFSSPALADPDYTGYFRDLRYNGIPVLDVDAAAREGLYICDRYRNGATFDQVGNYLVGGGISVESSGVIMAVAVRNLCPDQKPNVDHQAGM